MSGAWRYLRLFAFLVRTSLQNELAYRGNFLLRVVAALGGLLGELFTLWTIFANTTSLAGWGPYEVVVLLGVFRIMVGVIGLLIAPNMRTTMEDIRNGTLDFIITKPINAQFLASFRQIVVWRGIDALLGLVLVIAGSVMLSRTIPLTALATFLATMIAGTTIIYSFWLALATSVFWVTRLANIELVFWNVFHAGRYPLEVYSPWVRWLLTFVLPLAFLTSFPAAALVGRAGPGAILASAIVAPAALAAATLYWRMGLRRYSGASA